MTNYNYHKQDNWQKEWLSYTESQRLGFCGESAGFRAQKEIALKYKKQEGTVVILSVQKELKLTWNAGWWNEGKAYRMISY